MRDRPTRRGKCPHDDWGLKGHHHEHLLEELPLRAGTDFQSSGRSVFALSYRQYFRRICDLGLPSRLVLLLASNSGEGLPKVGIDASRVTKGRVEDTLHWCP